MIVARCSSRKMNLWGLIKMSNNRVKTAIEKPADIDRFILRVDGAAVMRGDRKAIMKEFDRLLRLPRPIKNVKTEYIGKAISHGGRKSC